MSDHEKSDREKPPPWRSEPDQRGLGVWYMALYALVLAALALVNVLVVFDAGTQDHQALQNEKRTVLAILNARLAALSSNAADNAVWTEAYQHLVVRFDRDWMLANYNDSFYKSYQADRLLLVGPDGRILHFLFRGMAGSGGAGAQARCILRGQRLRPDRRPAQSGGRQPDRPERVSRRRRLAGSRDRVRLDHDRRRCLPRLDPTRLWRRRPACAAGTDAR
jgi:predicted dehydrogenase